MVEQPVPVGIAASSDVGRARSTEANYDSYRLPLDVSAEQHAQKGWLFSVADGLGARVGEESGSQIAVNLIHQLYYADPSTDVAKSLARAVQMANEALFTKTGVLFSGLSASVACAVVKGHELFVIHAGDSRVYRINTETIQRLTTDAVLSGEASGVADIPTSHRPESGPDRPWLTQALGSFPGLVPNTGHYTLGSHDQILLCTQGLTRVVDDRELQAIVVRALPDDAVRQLVSLANERGGPENITAVVVAPRALLESAPALPAGRRYLPWVGLAGVGAILIVLIGRLLLFGFLNGPAPTSVNLARTPTTVAAAPTVAPITSPPQMAATGPAVSPGQTSFPPSPTPQITQSKSMPSLAPTAVPPTPVPVVVPSEPMPTALATPMIVPSPSPVATTRSAADILRQVSQLEATLRSGQIEATIAYGSGMTSTARLMFDLGDGARAARLHMLSTYVTAQATETVERITIGTQTWQRRANGPWTTLADQEGVWGQVQSFLPHAAAVSNSVMADGAGSTLLHWQDDARAAEVTLQVQPDNSTPRELQQLVRTSSAVLRVVYVGWNTPVEISAPR